MSEIFRNRNAELIVIGTLMTDARAHNFLTDLSPQDFTDPELRAVFKVITDLTSQNKPVSLPILDDVTKSTLTDTLLDASNHATSPVLIPHHVESIREASVRRQVSEIASTLYKDMGDRSIDLPACLESVRSKLGGMSTSRHEWISAQDLATDTSAWLEELSQGLIKPVASGITDIDNLIGGFYPGELTVVGAKPGTGKTVFGMLVGLHSALKGLKVGILNLEMLSTQYGTRIVSNLGLVDAMKLRKGTFDEEDRANIAGAIKTLSSLPAAFMFNTRHIEDLVGAVKNTDLDLLVVDYLQLVRTKQAFESERLRMAHISWALKELAVDKRIPIIAMSQLRRPDASASDKMPSMRDLRESGNLEADADGIILLHEPVNDKDPYVYKDDKPNIDTWRKQGLRYICLKVEKQRQGAVGTIPVLFDAKHMRYVGIERAK